MINKICRTNIKVGQILLATKTTRIFTGGEFYKIKKAIRSRYDTKITYKNLKTKKIHNTWVSSLERAEMLDVTGFKSHQYSTLRTLYS